MDFTKEHLKTVPTTRYQGSKRSILPWLFENLKKLDFKTVLDGFGGTAIVSYMFKQMGKKVTFNDVLMCNHINGITLLENDNVILSRDDLNFILGDNRFTYPTFIADTFKGIYYLSHENKWLDRVTFNIRKLSTHYAGDVLRQKQALSYYILFQACLCKRPFNLFHRKNLYLRTAKIQRTFGNKVTWDTSFRSLFLKFNRELSEKIFSTRFKHTALCEDIMNMRRTKFDLVYLDPPYAREHENIPKDYAALYHFFEGVLNYDNWRNMINWKTKNLALTSRPSKWHKNMEANFNSLFRKFQDSIIVLSYGDPGNPPITTIQSILKKYKSKVVITKRQYAYKLNHKNGGLYEALLIGQ